MSNSQVGAIYQQIIEDVLDSSRVDLEENGVDESILEELKLVSNPSPQTDAGHKTPINLQHLASLPLIPFLFAPSALGNPK